MKLKLKANKVSYSNILKNITFEADEGKITVLSGKPQSGKSTLLSILSGLIPPTTGSVSVNGERINDNPYNIGYIYDPVHLKQTSSTLPYPNNTSFKYNYVIINHKLETYGYISFNSSINNPSFFSNDIISIVDILLIDEMFPNCSHFFSQDYYNALYNYVKTEKKICIIAVSDNNHIYNYSDKIIYLNK